MEKFVASFLVVLLSCCIHCVYSQNCSQDDYNPPAESDFQQCKIEGIWFGYKRSSDSSSTKCMRIDVTSTGPNMVKVTGAYIGQYEFFERCECFTLPKMTLSINNGKVIYTGTGQGFFDCPSKLGPIFNLDATITVLQVDTGKCFNIEISVTTTAPSQTTTGKYILTSAYPPTTDDVGVCQTWMAEKNGNPNMVFMDDNGNCKFQCG